MTPREQWYLQMVLWPPIAAGRERNAYQYTVDEVVAALALKPWQPDAEDIEDYEFEMAAIEKAIANER